MNPPLSPFELDHDHEGLLFKVHAELDEYSESEILYLLETLDDTLNQWANENSYTRASLQTGFTKMAQWLSSSESPLDTPIDTVALVVDRLPEKPFQPYDKFLTQLSDDSALANSRLLALLILRELKAGNTDGAKQAARQHDYAYLNVRHLAATGSKISQGGKKGGNESAKTRSNAVASRQNEIKIIALELLELGRKKRELSSIIANRLGCSPKTARRYLQQLDCLKEK